MRPHNDPDVLSQALAEPSRRALLENLRYGQKTVTQLVVATSLKQPNVSNHLAKMKQQGIVRAERIGRQVYYSLSAPFADVLMRMHEIAADSATAGFRLVRLPSSVGNNIRLQAGQTSASFPRDALGAAQTRCRPRGEQRPCPQESAVTKRRFASMPGSVFCCAYGGR